MIYNLLILINTFHLMSATQQTSKDGDKIEMQFDGNKFILEKKLENNLINFNLSSLSFKNFKASLSLEDAISKFIAFEDYDLQECFDILNEDIKPEDFSLTEESGKYYLVIKITILKKLKQLKIVLEELEKSNEKIIADLRNLKIKNASKITKLNQILTPLLEEVKELEDKSKKWDEIIQNEKREQLHNRQAYYKKKIKLENKNISTNIVVPFNKAKSITALKDGRIVLGAPCEIILFTPKTYEIALEIKEENIDPDELIPLSTGKLLVLDNKKNIKIYDIKDKNYEMLQSIQLEKEINCLKELEAEYKAICATYDTSIAVYSLNDKNEYSEKYVIKSNIIKYCGFAQINTKKICVSTQFEGKEFLSFYDLDLKKPYAVIKGIPLTSQGFKLNNNYLYFCKNNCIYLIGINSRELVAQFKLKNKPDGNINNILGICSQETDMGRLIIISDSENNLIQIKIEGKKIFEYSRKSLEYSTNLICVLGNKFAIYHGNENEANSQIQILEKTYQ